MDLQRTNSDAIERSFNDSLKNGDSSFLLDTDELKLEDVIRLRTGTSEGEAAALGSSAIQESLLTLETGGLPEDEWLVASPSEVPEEKPRGFVVPGEKIRNPHDAILSSAPPEGMNIQAMSGSQPVVETRKRSISSPEPSGGPPILQPPRGRKGTGTAAMPQQEKVAKPGTTSAPESFTPSPPRLIINPAVDRLGDSKIPRSPLAKSTEALLASRGAGSAGLSPSKLPSPGSIPQSPKRPLTPCSSPLNKGSPMGESRIPKPRGGAQGATPETRKQRYAPRPRTPERSFPSGSSAGGRSSSSRPRSAKPKPKLADLEKGWVGNDIALDDKSEDLPFDGGEALQLAEELSAQTDGKGGISEDADLGAAKDSVERTAAMVAADSSSRFVDASTQVTPKVGGSAAVDGTTVPDAPADKSKACSCCTIM